MPNNNLNFLDLPRDIFFLIAEEVLGDCLDTRSKFKALIILTLTCKAFRQQVYEGDSGHLWRTLFTCEPLKEVLPDQITPSIFGPKILGKIPEILNKKELQTQKRLEQAICKSDLVHIIAFWILYAKNSEKISLGTLGLFAETHEQKFPFYFFWHCVLALEKEEKEKICKAIAFEAAQKGQTKSLRVCVSETSSHHENPTHTLLAHAVKHQQPSAVACILEAETRPPIEVNQVHSQTGETALEVAVNEFNFFIRDTDHPSVIIIGLLCAAGADTHQVISSDKFGMIQHFARHPQSPVRPVANYLSNPPEISPEIACIFDHPMVLQYALTRSLLDLEEHMRLACIAIECNSQNCLRFLLAQQYVSVKSMNEEGLTLLAFAVKIGEIQEIYDLLVARGADLNIRLGEEENTPLHLLCAHEELDAELLLSTISFLLEYPVDITARNKSGDTAMEILGQRIDAAAASTSSERRHLLGKAYRALEKALEQRENSAVAAPSQCLVM